MYHDFDDTGGTRQCAGHPPMIQNSKNAKNPKKKPKPRTVHAPFFPKFAFRRGETQKNQRHQKSWMYCCLIIIITLWNRLRPRSGFLGVSLRRNANFAPQKAWTAFFVAPARFLRAWVQKMRVFLRKNAQKKRGQSRFQFFWRFVEAKCKKKEGILIFGVSLRRNAQKKRGQMRPQFFPASGCAFR